MEASDFTPEQATPDLPERIESAVGGLALLAQRLAPSDAAIAEDAMALLAGLQQLVSWEPGEGRAPLKSAEGTAEQLRIMASIGPRPPAVGALLIRAAEMALSPPVIFGGANDTMAIATARQELAEAAERLLQAHRRIGQAL